MCIIVHVYMYIYRYTHVGADLLLGAPHADPDPVPRAAGGLPPDRLHAGHRGVRVYVHLCTSLSLSIYIYIYLHMDVCVYIYI